MGKTPSARPTVKQVKELENRIRALEEKTLTEKDAGELDTIRAELHAVREELNKLEKLLDTPAADPDAEPEDLDPEDEPDPDDDEKFWGKDL